MENWRIVRALTQTGGYSRYIVLRESELVRVPARLDPAEAVSLVLNYTTAYQLIHRIAKLRQGESMLIKGGQFVGYGMSAAIEGGRRKMVLAAASSLGSE
jgi:NADPH:quinone reductase-like Zn-dependent oxidoreductase